MIFRAFTPEAGHSPSDTGYLPCLGLIIPRMPLGNGRAPATLVHSRTHPELFPEGTPSHGPARRDLSCGTAIPSRPHSAYLPAADMSTPLNVIAPTEATSSGRRTQAASNLTVTRNTLCLGRNARISSASNIKSAFHRPASIFTIFARHFRSLNFLFVRHWRPVTHSAMAARRGNQEFT